MNINKFLGQNSYQMQLKIFNKVKLKKASVMSNTKLHELLKIYFLPILQLNIRIQRFKLFLVSLLLTFKKLLLF